MQKSHHIKKNTHINERNLNNCSKIISPLEIPIEVVAFQNGGVLKLLKYVINLPHSNFKAIFSIKNTYKVKLFVFCNLLTANYHTI